MTLLCGHYILGYTGVSQVDGQPTDMWLSLEAAGASVDPDVIESLRVAAERAMITSRHPPPQRRLALVGVGWTKSGPTSRPEYVITSNFTTRTGWGANATPDFRVRRTPVKLRRGFAVFWAGASPKRADRKVFAKQLERCLSEDGSPASVLKLLVRFARAIAQNNLRTVGMSMLAGVLPRGASGLEFNWQLSGDPMDFSRPLFVLFPERGQEPRWRGANVACGGLAMMHLQPVFEGDPLPGQIIATIHADGTVTRH